MKPARFALGLSLATLVLLACGSSSRTPIEEGSGGAAATGPGGGSGDFGQADASMVEATALGHLKGTVYAPEGTVPISNALVYLSPTAPLVQAPGVYCDACVQLPAGTPYAYSKPDGTFSLPVYATGPQFLVVQKGQFRRVRQITAAEGEAALDKALTTLPGTPDLAGGDEIPRIAIAHGGFDKIALSLKKLGITSFDRFGRDPFADPPGMPPTVAQNPREVIAAADTLARYNIVLLPCSLGGLKCGGPSDGEKTLLRDYVNKGGKLYVTDYSYEFVNQTWPGFITWKDKEGKDLQPGSGEYGAACQDNAYTQPGKPEDSDLGAWLSAIGEGTFDLRDSWTKISKVSPMPGTDEKGNPVTITPKVWMTSQGTGPSTVSFENGCGRVLFSTYHAEGGVEDALLAQEKALLYILLEVGVCVGELPPPR